MRENYTEDRMNAKLDRKEGSDLQQRLEKILPAVEGQYKDYLNHGHERLWQMKNSTIINLVLEAKKMLEEYHSSQLIQKAMEDREIDSEYDNARSLAFARLIELGSKEIN